MGFEQMNRSNVPAYRSIWVVFLLFISMSMFGMMPVIADSNEEDRSDEYFYAAKVAADGVIPDLDASMDICGANEDGVLGDDCTVDTSRRILSFSVPENSMGDEVKFKIKNQGTPHYVDLDISLCWDIPDEFTIMCDKKHSNVYEGETKYITIFSIRSSIYYLLLDAKEGTGGDETSFSYSYSRVSNSNNDRLEPEYIQLNSSYDRSVCQSDCVSGLSDPVDLFYFEIYKGDKVELELWSRESSPNTNRVRFYWRADYELQDYTTSKWISLEDYVTKSNPYPISGTAVQTTGYWLYMIADGSGSLDEPFSYSFEISVDSSARDLSSDVDGDGLTDIEEDLCGSDKFDSGDTAIDSDSDGQCNLTDNDDDGDGILDNTDPCPISSYQKPDLDQDGCEDESDTDDDNDGLSDEQDSCPYGLLELSTITSDLDSDGCMNSEDFDDDGDGYSDEHEEDCGTSGLDGNDVPVDFDADLICDLLDVDDDGDGVDDTLDSVCPRTPLDSPDFDGDGCENIVDADDDNDGIFDANDSCTTSPPNLVGTSDVDGNGCFDGEDPDIDGDTWSNEDELSCFTDQYNADESPLDNDGDRDCDVLDSDDDNDGWSDSDELKCDVGNPFVPSITPLDNDQDHLCDSLDDDDDNDGWIDILELSCMGGDPNLFAIVPADFDSDEVCDSMDEDIDGDSINNDLDYCDKTPQSQLKNGDLDNDGCFDGGEDPDIDGDGIMNSIDSCPSSFVLSSSDSNSDGCDDDVAYSTVIASSISSAAPLIIVGGFITILLIYIIKSKNKSVITQNIGGDNHGVVSVSQENNTGSNVDKSVRTITPDNNDWEY
jgi:hypothetical protein